MVDRVNAYTVRDLSARVNYAVADGETLGIFKSGNHSTRRDAWRDLVRLMGGAILELRALVESEVVKSRLLQREADRLKEEIKKLIDEGGNDQVLAAEVRQRHELMEEVDRLDRNLDEERKKFLDLKTEFDALHERNGRMQIQRDNTEAALAEAVGRESELRDVLFRIKVIVKEAGGGLFTTDANTLLIARGDALFRIKVLTEKVEEPK